MAPGLKQFQLLEMSIISAQDLKPVARNMNTYATAWIHANRKLSTHIDTQGNNNPTWDDKFVFQVDEDFLRCETSAITIEIYTTQWYRDTLVGTVRVLVGNILPPPPPDYSGDTRCVALQVRRPSGRPQGILNIGVAVVDRPMTSMPPLYRQLSASADLMELENDESYCHHQTHDIYQNQNNSAKESPVMERRYPLENDRSRSLLDEWKKELDLWSKHERKRFELELPPLYDMGSSTSPHGKGDGEGDGGWFSCFMNICGYECQCICGKPPSAKSHGGQLRSPSIGSSCTSMSF